MKILIIEDEPRAANQLEFMLKECDFQYQLMDIIDTVEDSIEWLKKNQSPDLIFMDIQLADGLSFEIFHSVEVKAPIIFTTAFDQYAIQAFKVNSVDYLLKPIQKEDLQFALNKFNASKSPPTVNTDIFKQLLSQMQSPSKRKGILVKDGGGLKQIRIEDILYFYSEDSITFGVTKDNKRHIIDETMDQLFHSLDINQFFKINRGQIVATHAVQKISPYFNHRVKLTVVHSRDQEFVVSRQKTSEFKEWMNK